jgi:hypothetical protein
MCWPKRDLSFSLLPDDPVKLIPLLLGLAADLSVVYLLCALSGLTALSP